ncbi:acetyl-CoA acetyltransferase [Achromobacter denitrificans]|uniref:acetyl-CoA acetyltransferase n=1 Tax=Achromobacter denitrificans TaxID=32002 RepID=UPI00078753EE|nr:acetyl-CoA acetyltransferase [Achromobacter denitrificans]MPT41155.1 thiolase [Achromobacter sp.]ASC65821.1 thiolase [Achromobacter denitrificans]OLU09563.1 thiolase [Achromobacter denitrificans]QKH43101.1 thiolase [Achromobacter denitrificans]QKH49757.1 thiolase [Achromobacter denitrificans]
MTDWNKSLRGSIAITGCATAGIGDAGGLNDLEVSSLAIHAAVRDAGLRMEDIDGLMSASLSSSMWLNKLAEYLGVYPRFMDSLQIGGASFVGHLLIAAAAIQAGLCRNIVIAYGATPRGGNGVSATSGARAKLDPFPYEEPFQPFNPPTSYALATRRHMHEYGTTREQLAEVAVAARAWARLNPEAYKRDPLSIDEVLSARVISSPLTARDCCLVTDGAGAIVVTAAERAEVARPVYVLGTALAHSHRQIACMADLTRTVAGESAGQARERAGVSLADIDLVQLYDAFTINPILFLEDMGFCRKGEGGAFVSGGRIAPGGELPVNTNGGGLSCVHPGMYSMFGLVEAVRQLRGECGERQVKQARTALVHGNGGVLSAQATTVLTNWMD